ncbi:twin-arginine translocase subunit TatC [Oceanobacillus piezotolerans]|uniref:Sec-independent protein translocase protein TatC n=1 Tax=Oceanobacillus piezotolerans TaxID=2448030 RepID=A0A498DI85_9BACI|nr:twin-arginine translocase subunit TatC [Oceanobacillus piezotolerans]RLL48249.1 twin-arginine translocase subunit TatC [Oceanobacillus piezotolerans]
MGENQPHDKDMDVVGHLSELRNRLIVTIVVFFIFLIIGFLFVEDIYYFFAKDLEFKLTAISPGEILWVYFAMAGLIAVVGTIPLLSYQIWAFVKPGLTPKERRVSLAYIPALFFLFIAGLVFGYLLFTNLVIPFLLTLNNGMFDVMFTIDRYFKFLIRVTFPLALLFELPIVVMFLTSLGIITPEFMKKWRKYAYFVLVVISTLITPPDFITPILVSIPLIILYEISIHLSKIVYRKKEEKHKAFMNEESV